jgi:hypothetical protein
MKATCRHCHGHLVYATDRSHDISTEKCTILAHLYEMRKNICKMWRFYFMVALSQEVCTFGKAKEVGLLWEFAKVAQKGNSTILDTSLANYQRGEDFVSLFER